MGLKVKKLIWPAVLAGCLAVPGVVTFGFAMNEANSWQSDWVMISGGLLGLAGVILLVGLAKGLKLVGALVGAGILIAGGVWFYSQLAPSIKERQQHQENYYALKDVEEDVAKLCSAPKPYDKAAAFDPQKKGIHPGFVFILSEPYDGTSSPPAPRRETMGDFSKWAPKKASEIELVGCIQESTRAVESCQYTGGTLYRRQQIFDIKVIALKTGEVVLTDQLVGGMPEPCKDVEEFYADSITKTKVGLRPAEAEFVARLKPAMHLE